MKVALVTSIFPSPEHPYIWEWINGLKQAGIDVTVLTERFPDLSADPFFRNPELVNKVRLINQLDHPVYSFRNNYRYLLRSFLSIESIVHTQRVINNETPKKLSRLRKWYEYFPHLSEKFDLVHFNGPQIAIRRFELARIFRAPSLVSFRGQDFTFFPDRYDRLLRDADHLHFISNHLIEEAQKRGYKGSKHTLTPPMVDTHFYYPEKKEDHVWRGKGDRFTIFTAARFSWTKGWEFALQAVALLVEKGWDVHYNIAGGGEFKEAIVYTVHELGLDDRVTLLGWLSPAQVREQMWNSDLYVLASVEEGFNNGVLQAQACGLPVVCSDAGGLPENIEDGVTGFLTRRRDAWDLARKIEVFLSDPSLLASVGINGRKRVTSYFTLEENIRHFVSMYELLVNHH